MTQQSTMSETERQLLSDPFLEATTDVNWPARSDEFKKSWFRKFDIEPPKLSSFDEALERRTLEDVSPRTTLRGAVNAILRSESGRAELMERDPKFKTRIKGQLIAEAAEEFRRRCTDYIAGPEDINRDTLAELLHKKYFGYLPNPGFDFDEIAEKLWDAGHWEPENLVAAYEEGVRMGLMALPSGQLRKLSEIQKLDVISVSQIDGPEFGILKYIGYALGEPVTARTTGDIAWWRASNSSLWNEALFYVFRGLHGSVLSDDQFSDFEQAVRERMKLPTYRDLQEALGEFRRDAKPSAPLPGGRQATQETEDPDSLSDEELSQRILQARRAARSARAVL